MNKTSVRFRIVISVATNFSRVVIGFATGLAIARFLGPADYGNLNFLLGSFAAFANLIDMGTSAGFYTFVAQKGRGRNFVIYYTAWLMLQLLMLSVFVLLLPPVLKKQIWLGQHTSLVLLALLASFSMNQIWNFTGQIGESIRDTLGVQMRNLFLTVAYLLCVLGLFRFKLLNIKWLLLTNGLLYLLVAFVYWIKLVRRNPFPSDVREDLKSVVGEFKRYVFPVMTFVGFCYAFIDPWLLQKFGGAEQQGFYAVGAKVAAVSFIAATAMSQVLWKELAESYRKLDLDRVRLLFSTFSRGLFIIPAILGCSLMPFTREILNNTVGAAYVSAWLPFAIMLFYPLHQSLNIVYDITLLATGRTKTRSRIIILFFVSSIFASYLFLAPRSALIPGLAWGAVGLSLKMVMCQLMQTTLNGYYASKYIQTPYNWIFQAVILAVLVPLGFLSKYLAQGFLSSLNLAARTPSLVVVFLAFYVTMTLVLFYCFPHLAGLSRQQLKTEIIALKRWAYPG